MSVFEGQEEVEPQNLVTAAAKAREQLEAKLKHGKEKLTPICRTRRQYVQFSIQDICPEVQLAFSKLDSGPIIG